MIRSMTAFSRCDVQEKWGQICWELRSVNHRYLDVTVRLPEEFRSLEMTVREHLQAKLKRGKIECSLRFQANETETHLHVNMPLVKKLWDAMQTVHINTGELALPNALDILSWQGVLEKEKLDIDIMSDTLLTHLDTTVNYLVHQREKEGNVLTHLLQQRCDSIEKEVAIVKANLPTILQTQRERLETRLAELKANLDQDRIEQEIVILAQKMDVAEELERIEAHLDEIRYTLQQDEAAGKRLDFLVQELHREANTLGSKSNHIDTTRSVVELKVMIGQMREQIQNIE